MSVSTLNLSVSDKLSPKKTKAQPHLVVFADSDAKILGNLDSGHLDRAKALIKASGFKGSVGENVTDYGIDDGHVISVIGTGSLDKLAGQMPKLGKATFNTIKNSKSAVVAWGDVICQKHFGQFVNALLHAEYRFEPYKSKKGDKIALSAVEFINTKDAKADYENALAIATATHIGQSLARDVANDAPNIMTPAELAKVAEKLGKDYKDVVSVSVLGEKR